MPDQWQQRAGFSVFFDVQSPGPGGPGEVRRRTRLYHEETGEEVVFPGWGVTDWMKWMLDRLGSAAGGTVTAELQLRVSGVAELDGMVAARVTGVWPGPDHR